MYLIIFFFFFPFSIMYTNASYYILYIEYVQVARYLQVECEAGGAKDLDCHFPSTLWSWSFVTFVQEIFQRVIKMSSWLSDPMVLVRVCL